MKCNAKAKGTGKRCNRDAIISKDKCHMHGGATPLKKDGSKSKYPLPQLVKEQAEQYYNDPKLVDIRWYLAEQRAVMSALKSQAKDRDNVPLEVYESLQRTLERATKTLERMENIEIKKEYLVHIQKFQSVVAVFVEVIDELAQTEEQKAIAIKRLEVEAAMKDGNGNSRI